MQVSWIDFGDCNQHHWRNTQTECEHTNTQVVAGLIHIPLDRQLIRWKRLLGLCICSLSSQGTGYHGIGHKN